jgi:hypothetical protein
MVRASVVIVDLEKVNLEVPLVIVEVLFLVVEIRRDLVCFLG